MSAKRIGMIILLIAVVTVIIIGIVNLRTTPKETLANKTRKETKADVTNKSTIRKGKENIEIDENNIIRITDEHFIEETNQFFANLDEYIGKTVQIDGFIYTYQDKNGDICYAVVRNAPGCCGDDGLAGLDIRYNGDYPEEGTWVKAVGLVDSDTALGMRIPVIQVAVMEETEEGVTFVAN